MFDLSKAINCVLIGCIIGCSSEREGAKPVFRDPVGNILIERALTVPLGARSVFWAGNWNRAKLYIGDLVGTMFSIQSISGWKCVSMSYE